MWGEAEKELQGILIPAHNNTQQGDYPQIKTKKVSVNLYTQRYPLSLYGRPKPQPQYLETISRNPPTGYLVATLSCGHLQAMPSPVSSAQQLLDERQRDLLLIPNRN